MRSTLPLLAAIAVSVISAASIAQETKTWIDRDPQPSFPFSPPEAPHRHSSTALEGYLRGLAALTRAEADYMIGEGQAGIMWEQIYAMRMDNFLKKAQTHFDWKKLMTEERHEARISKIVRSEELRMVKQWSNSRRELREALENPLSEYDVDFRTGMVYWPALVSGPRYAKYRQELDQFMGGMIGQKSLSTTANREQLNKVCRDFRNQLRKDLAAHMAKDLPTVQAEFDSVERLIDGLRYTPVVMAQAAPEMISMN